jgi:uncharacterized protein YcbX
MSYQLLHIFVYPIKSCAAHAASAAWPLVPPAAPGGGGGGGGGGLLLDREWVVADPDGAVLSQKAAPALARVRPEVRLAEGVLRVTCAGGYIYYYFIF